MKKLRKTLEAFLQSEDFKQGVFSSTRASWGGSSYNVELFTDGTWRVLWSNQIGNKYETPGIILTLPVLDQEAEEETFDDWFYNDEEELKDEMRTNLVEAF